MDTRQLYPKVSSLHFGLGWRRVVVPLLLFAASLFMALAWLGHLRFKQLPFGSALMLSWLLVLPEYGLNVAAIRWGYPVFTGAQMASFRLCFGVIGVALVSRFFLGEAINGRQFLGFGLMVLAIILITSRGSGSHRSVLRSTREK